jgi:hypothetical protein
MAHDATKVAMGSTYSSDKDISDYVALPATYVAGLAVRRANSASAMLSVAVGDGQYAGVSLGASLSDTSKVSVVRSGLRVPILLEAKPAYGEVEITAYASLVDGTDDTVTVGATAFTAQAGAATPGQATFQAATDDATTATSLAAQINAHATAGALVEAVAVGAVVQIRAKANTVAGDDIALSYEQLGTGDGATVSDTTLLGGGDAPDYVVIGAKVYISDTTGKADDAYSASTISDAVYVSGVLTGIAEDGSEVYAALVDMPGGL